jgi:hypothetical protein
MKKIITIAIASFSMVSLVLAFGCSKSDPVDAMIVHNKSMVKIMQDNIDDCDKVVSELEAYANKNKAAFAELKKTMQEKEKNLSEEEKTALTERLMKKMAPVLKENMKVMMEITKKCPNHSAKINSAMSALK